MLPVLIRRRQGLYEELRSGVHTNLSFGAGSPISDHGKPGAQGKYQRGVIGKEYVLFAESPDKLSILIPLPDKIHALRDEIFTTSSALGPLTPGSELEKMAAEGARISINNQSHTAGLPSLPASY